MKTAEQLGITEAEHRVLIMAKDWLLKSQPAKYCPIEGNGKFEFYMGRTLNHAYKPEPEPDCKSQGCIWGLCHILATVNKIDAFKTSPYGGNHTRDVGGWGVSPVLDTLFFPHRANYRVDYGYVTPAMAAQWIEAWMTTGEFDLDLLMRGEEADEGDDD